MRFERLLLIAVGLWLAFELAVDALDGRPAEDPAAALRTAAMIEALEGQGWVVETAEEVRGRDMLILDLIDDTTALRDQLAAAHRQIEIHGGQMRALTELRAEVRAALELEGIAHGPPVLPGEPAPASDSVTWEYSDPTFTIGAAFHPPTTLVLDPLAARIHAAITMTEAADGRMLFGAVAADPRVTLQIATAAWDPPPPVLRCTLPARARTGAASIAAWELLQAGLRAVR